MCQQQVIDPKTRLNRQCKLKGEPYCKRHARIMDEAVEVCKEALRPVNQDFLKRMMETPVDLFKKGSCHVCMDDKKIYPTDCCEFKICRSCLIKNAKTNCCHCNKKLNIDDSTLDLIQFIQEKDKQVNSLTSDLFAHRNAVQFVVNQPVNMVRNDRRARRQTNRYFD